MTSGPELETAILGDRPKERLPAVRELVTLVSKQAPQGDTT